MNLVSRGSRQRGVSLIEALVALAVMAIGMLGIVGVQATLRTNSDVAKQRSEALRLAQFDIERQRAFVAIGPSTSASAYLGIQAASAAASGVNTTFTITRGVVDLPASSPGKAVNVSVAWTDRTSDSTQRVQLATVITGIAPDLAPTLSVPGDGDTVRRPGGRNRGIPISAKDLGNGTSGFIPPGATGGLAWRFDNVTGLITVCTTTATVTEDIATLNLSCGTDVALLLAGFIRYSVPSPATTPPSSASFTPLATLATEPASLEVGVNQTQPTALAGIVGCFTGPFDSETLAYFCALPVLQITGTTPAWSGTVGFAYPTTNPGISGSYTSQSPARRKVCRYPQTSATYALESKSRVNQNFLVIRAGTTSGPGVSYTCETHAAPTVRFQP